MPRRINIKGSSEKKDIPEADFVDQAADIFLKHARQTLEQEKLQTEILEEKAKRNKIDDDSKGWRIQRTARRAMLVLAGVLSFGAIGDAAVPDTEEYMNDASAIELVLFHNETDPIELLGLVVPLLGGAAYRRKKKDTGARDED